MHISAWSIPASPVAGPGCSCTTSASPITTNMHFICISYANICFNMHQGKYAIICSFKKSSFCSFKKIQRGIVLNTFKAVIAPRISGPKWTGKPEWWFVLSWHFVVIFYWESRWVDTHFTPKFVPKWNAGYIVCDILAHHIGCITHKLVTVT